MEELYRLYYNRLLNFSKAITHSAEDAEEIVEDVYVKLWCNRKTIMTINNLAVYLYVAVKNRSLTYLQRKNKDLQTPLDRIDFEYSDPHQDPCAQMVSAEMIKKMQSAVDSLPPRCKMIFTLVRLDGLRYKEVAEILNISVNTIDVQMAIAVRRICSSFGTADGSSIFSQSPSRKNK